MVSGVQLGVIVILLYAVILDCVSGGGTQWATPDQEALDEVRDAEIFKAVVTSMREWRNRHASHRRKRADSSVCYPEVGCFQDSGPFSYLDMLPSPPEEVATKFVLYSGKSSPSLDVTFNNMSSIWGWARQTFNVSAPTKVIVHGFGGSCGHVWVYEMRSALMTVEECNLICVDWEAGAVIPNYVRAAANTRLVGKQLSLLLEGLNKHLGLPIQNVHIIGFSLGAHVAGFAGADLKNLSRITGLDPAAPLFESQDPRARLDSTDAMFVDVIHSNGENLILGGLGSWQPMGHVDFYPNGGRMQKGCTNLFVGAVTDILWSASDVEGRSLCNHRRAYKFFTDSVSPRCHFPSFPCGSYDKFIAGECFPCNGDRQCGNMGYYADRSSGRGTLFLITREEEPFCAHQYHVRVDNSHSPVPVTSYGKIELTLIGSADINETMALTQKDDEELKMGSSLARIAVPHPVLQEPRSVEIMYTAYSGWISSGLSSWSVDKVTLTDSFGKSMSVCKKDLVLESGIPVTLPLYPGECNPPRDIVKDKDSVSSTQPSTEKEQNASKDPLIPASPNSTVNLTQFTPTPVFLVGDELFDKNSTLSNEKKDIASLLDSPHALESIPWQPMDILDSSNTNTLDGTQSKRESARSFNTFMTNVILYNTTSTLTNDSVVKTSNSQANMSETITTSERPEIKEPVLMPSSSPLPLIWPRDASLTKSAMDVAASINLTTQSHVNKKPEITEPVLNPKKSTTTSTTTEPNTPRPSMVKPREISQDTFGNYHNEQNSKWMPAVELNPPPLGGTETWQHWLTETTASNSISSSTEKPVLEEKSIDISNSTQGDGRRLGFPSPSKVNKKSSPITIQFFPQRLAALLAQAEHYARLTLSFPISAMSKLMYNKSSPPESKESDQETSASNNKLYTLSLPEELQRRSSNLKTQRRPKHFPTTRPITNENSSVTSQKSTNKSGKVSEMQPRMDKAENLQYVKDLTQKDNVYVPYSYSYSAPDNSESKKGTEMSRFIPLSHYSEPNKDNLKYEISQNYSKVRNARHSSMKVPTYMNVETFNSDKEDDTDYNSYHSDISRHAYPTVPER